MAEKRTPDYSESAENLCNPDEVRDILIKLHVEQSIKEELERKLKEQCADLVEGIARSSDAIANLQKEIRGAIDIYGSYQDTESGEYAVKYRRITKSYNAELFMDNYIKYAPAVIEESVNVAALNGLIKGGLVDERELREKGVIEESVDFAYVVR